MDDLVALTERRKSVSDTIANLVVVLDTENEAFFVNRCDPSVAAVLRACSKPKQFPIMREIQVVSQLQDPAATCGLVSGLVMLGLAALARGLFQR